MSQGEDFTSELFLHLPDLIIEKITKSLKLPDLKSLRQTCTATKHWVEKYSKFLQILETSLVTIDSNTTLNYVIKTHRAYSRFYFSDKKFIKYRSLKKFKEDYEDQITQLQLRCESNYEYLFKNPFLKGFPNLKKVIFFNHGDYQAQMSKWITRPQQLGHWISKCFCIAQKTPKREAPQRLMMYQCHMQGRRYYEYISMGIERKNYNNTKEDKTE